MHSVLHCNFPQILVSDPEGIVCVDNCFIDGDNSFNESFLSSAPMPQVLLQNKVEHNILHYYIATVTHKVC